MRTLRSLVLITVDCLRADHVGFSGYDRKTTLFLDELASESRVLRNAIVAGAPTYYSFPAIMASRYPLSLGLDVIGLARMRSLPHFRQMVVGQGCEDV
jgi:arylsulfatase A-like enzyme